MNQLDVRTPVVLLSSNPTAVLHGVLGAARSLGRLGVPVHVVHPAPRTPMYRSRYVHSFRQLSLRRDDPHGYVQALMVYGAELGHRPVLIACDDVAAVLVADHQELLRDRFRLRVPSAELSRVLSDKSRLAGLCARLGIDTPLTLLPLTVDDVDAFAGEVGFPVVVKIADPEVLPTGPGVTREASVQLVDTLAELHRVMGDGPRVRPGRVLQQYVDGGAESSWMFNGYVDAQGQCRHGYTGRKLRQCRPGTGYTSLGVCEDNPEVEAIVKRLLGDGSYQGIVDLDVLHDARTGRYLLVDVNPRVGATFRLFVGADGTDVVRALYADLTDQPLPPSGTQPGRRWVTELHDTYAALLYRRAGTLTTARWIRSYRRVDERAWWAADDPVPFAAMVGWVAVRGLGHLRDRLGSGLPVSRRASLIR